MELVFGPGRVAGEVSVPGDKSVTHRAYVLAAVARGVSRVRGMNPGADCEATLAAVRALGVQVEERAGAGTAGVGSRERLVTGRPDGFEAPKGALDLGNSATGLRLLAGLLAGRNVVATLTGDASLRARPMARILEPLRAMGGRIRGAAGDTRAPLHVRGSALDGRLLAGRAHETEVASAQVKSCLLFAGLAAQGTTSVHEPALSRDHTERLLPRFGVAVAHPAPLTVAVTGPAAAAAAEVDVPGDFSAAFFWLVAGTLAGAGELVVRRVGLNPTRTGGLLVLRRMGADIRVENASEAAGEPVGDLVVRPANLRAADVAAEEIPVLIDELPALAVAQALAEGTSRVAGAGELRTKESDRITLVGRCLQAVGGNFLERPDGWDIVGGRLGGGAIDSAGDHRIAMSFGVAALAAAGPVRIAGAEMIDTSYPGFYSGLRDRVTSR